MNLTTVIKAFFILTISLMFMGICLAQETETTRPMLSEYELRMAYDRFLDGMDTKKITLGYAKSVSELNSGSFDEKRRALAVLGASQEVDSIPFILPFLDGGDSRLAQDAIAALDKIVVGNELKRRDPARPESVVILPLSSSDRDLRPLAWLLVKLVRSGDSSFQSAAADMIGYLGLTEFRADVEALKKSMHPAVTNAAKFALEKLDYH